MLILTWRMALLRFTDLRRMSFDYCDKDNCHQYYNMKFIPVAIVRELVELFEKDNGPEDVLNVVNH